MLACALIGGLSLVACGGSQSAVVTPIALASAAPTTTATIPVSSTNASNVTLAALGGISPIVTVPAASATDTGNVVVSESLAPPSGVSALASKARHTLSINNALLFVTLVATSSVTLRGTPGFALTFSADFGTDPIGFAVYDPIAQAWSYGAGVVTVSGKTVTVAPGTIPFPLVKNLTYAFAFYSTAPTAPSASPTPTAVPSASPSATPTSSATPSPTPTSSPTPTPTPTPVPTPGNPSPNPASVAVYAGGPGVSFSVTESNYTGAFTAVSQNTSIATVTPTGATTATTFTVNSGATAGTTTIVLTDSNGHTGTVSVGNTVSTGTINSVGRKI